MRIKAEHKEHLKMLKEKSNGELIDMIADLQLKLRVEKAQAMWLDRLADELRDGEESDESDELYEEYKREEKEYRSKMELN